MPEEERPPEGRERPRAVAAKVPLYFISILLIFVGPGAALLAKLWRRLPKAPFFAAVAAVSVIGWPWSYTVSLNRWWTFGQRYMLGWEVVPHLPFEEFLFYPLGGALCILIYVALLGDSPDEDRGRPPLYWAFLGAGSAAFGALAWARFEHGPYYLLSQFAIYNVGCGLLLAPWTARRIDLRALAGPIAGLGLAGYLWDHVAFKYGWWAYHAVTGIEIGIVPIDDFNFFLYAPTAAVALYHVFCDRFGRPAKLPG